MQGRFRLHFVEFPLEDLIADAACGFLLQSEILEDHHSCMGSSIMTNLDRTTCPGIKKRIGSSKSAPLWQLVLVVLLKKWNKIRVVIFRRVPA